MSDSPDISPSSVQIATGLGDLVSLVRRHILLIAGTALILTVVAAVVLSNVAPRYAAKAHLMIGQSPSNPVNLDMMIGGLGGDPETVLSEIEILRSTRLADMTIESLNLDERAEFNPALRPPGLVDRVFGSSINEAQANGVADAGASADRVTIIRGFLQRLNVEPLPGSRVVTVRFSSQDPELAANVANTLSDLYLRDQLESKFEAVQRASAWLNERVSSLREKVQISEREVEAFREESGLLEGGGTTLTDQQLAQLNSEVLSASQARASATAQLQQVRQLVADGKGAEAVGKFLDSPLLERLREQLVGLQRRQAELSTEFGERHPTMVQLRADTADLRAKVDEEIAKVVTGLESSARVARARERSAKAQLEKAKLRTGEDNQALVTLRSLEREAGANRLLLETMLARFTETSAQDDLASQRPDARVIAAALVPVKPSYPMTTAILALTFVSAAFLGLMLAFARELMDGAARSGEQLATVTGVRSLGFIPRVSRRQLDGLSPPDYLLAKPRAAYSEAVRTIYAWLMGRGQPAPACSLLITSALAHEGKSTLAASLARTIASAGVPVIVIDTDSRNASIARILGVEAEHGLNDLLNNQVTLADVVIKDKSGAHVLTAGTATDNPQALLASSRFELLIQTLKTRFQYVIIDSPPIMGVSDALVLGRIVDSTVVVARWGSTRHESVAMTVRLLREAGANIVGTVLSMVDARKYARYEYGDSGAYSGKLKRYYQQD